jgi:hypothetical protein
MREITIGTSQYNPARLRIFYSKEKAQLVFSRFVLDFKAVVEYEEKATDNSNKAS